MLASATTLIDTGPLVAILRRADLHHEKCLLAFQQVPAPLLTCWPVITETMYILGESSDGAKKLFELLRSDALMLLTLDVSDLTSIQAILSKYSDQDFQLADACLMHLANREQIQQVLTLDRKDFTVFRKQNGHPLTLIPE